jgi:hypothetical protein
MRDAVTVFRSSDPRAHEEAAAALELLANHGLSGGLTGDNARTDFAAVWEMKAKSKYSAEAEVLIADSLTEDDISNVNASHDLDLVAVFRSAGNNSEIEGLLVKGILDAAGIYAMIENDSRFPNLPAEVRVPRDRVIDAKRLIADALAAEAGAAYEAEAVGEHSRLYRVCPRIHLPLLGAVYSTRLSSFSRIGEAALGRRFRDLAAFRATASEVSLAHLRGVQSDEML